MTAQPKEIYYLHDRAHFDSRNKEEARKMPQKFAERRGV